MRTLRAIISDAGFSPIPSMSGRSYIQAAVQDAMSGLTHFYDDASMRFFSCKVRKARSLDDGAILGTICTQAEGFHGGRVYVVNFHDFTGTHLGGDLEERSFKTMKQAETYFWATANAFNGREIVRDALNRERDTAKRKARNLSAVIRKNARTLKGVQS